MRWEFVRLFVRSKENFSKAFSTLWDDLQSAARELFVQIPHDILYFLRSLWFYKSFLWNDRDWDYAHILYALEAKIRKTRICIEKHGHHENSDKDVAEMKQAEAMILAILEDDFGKELREKHDAKWGPSKGYHVPVPGSTSSYWRSDRANTHTPKQREQERKEYLAMIHKEAALEQKTWEDLWQFLSLNMRKWWD